VTGCFGLLGLFVIPHTSHGTVNVTVMPNKKQKLNIPVLGTLDESQVTDLRDALLASNKEDVQNLLLYLMSSSGILALKLSLEKRPSFSSATWDGICREFNLDPGNGPGQLAVFDVPHLFLPPSVHKRILMAAMRTMDVYREPQSHNNEAARVRLFEAVSEALVYCMTLLTHRSGMCHFVSSFEAA